MKSILFLCLFAITSIAHAETTVIVKTNYGDIEVKLFDQKAPATVKNFLSYVDEGFYNNTLFHRVIPDFMIQGGGFIQSNGQLTKKPNKTPVVNESNNGLKNNRGTISMARLPHPDSATSQFFFNLIDNPQLDARGNHPGYTVFGEITKGIEVIDKIAAVPTEDFVRYQDVPKTPVIIEGISYKVESK